MRDLLWILLLGASLHCTAAETVAGGGTPIRTDISAVADNPALAPIFKEDAPALFTLGGQAYVDDSDRLLDELLETQELGLALERSSRGFLIIPGQEQPLVDQLKQMDGHVTATSGGVNGSLFLPGEGRALQFNFHLGGRGAGMFIYEPDDEDTLRFATINGLFSTADLKSRVVVSGVITTDVGVTYARPLKENSPVHWGVTGKYQHINLIERLVDIDEYEEDRLFDRHRDIEDYYHPNLDAGIRWQRGAMQLSASALNLNPGEFEGPLGSRYHQRAEVKLGAAYQPRWGGLAVQWDALPNPGFGVSEDLQKLRLSANVNLLERLNVSLGYNIVQEGQNDNTLEAGIRYQLGQLFVQAHGLIASSHEFGGGFQAQLVF